MEIQSNDQGLRPQRVQNVACSAHVDPMGPCTSALQRIIFLMHVSRYRFKYPRLHGERPGAARRATGFPCSRQYTSDAF